MAPDTKALVLSTKNLMEMVDLLSNTSPPEAYDAIAEQLANTRLILGRLAAPTPTTLCNEHPYGPVDEDARDKCLFCENRRRRGRARDAADARPRSAPCPRHPERGLLALGETCPLCGTPEGAPTPRHGVPTVRDPRPAPLSGARGVDMRLTVLTRQLAQLAGEAGQDARGEALLAAAVDVLKGAQGLIQAANAFTDGRGDEAYNTATRAARGLRTTAAEVLEDL
ncbi:hypothetical protein [Embleya sp. NPDC005575]|uniref:hypothetical protein n=1 Tax=Embleya sp. NPDC005575 TaxID=3156892 RepID=UPI0033ACBE98